MNSTHLSWNVLDLNKTTLGGFYKEVPKKNMRLHTCSAFHTVASMCVRSHPCTRAHFHPVHPMSPHWEPSMTERSKRQELCLKRSCGKAWTACASSSPAQSFCVAALMMGRTNTPKSYLLMAVKSPGWSDGWRDGWRNGRRDGWRDGMEMAVGQDYRSKAKLLLQTTEIDIL